MSKNKKKRDTELGTERKNDLIEVAKDLAREVEDLSITEKLFVHGIFQQLVDWTDPSDY